MKNTHLDRLYAHLRAGHPVERVSRWSSDVAFASGQSAISLGQAYDLADKLLDASSRFPKDQVEGLRTRLRNAIALGCGHSEAWEYIFLIDDIRDGRQRDTMRGVIESSLERDLDYPTAVRLAKDALAKPDASQEDLEAWLGGMTVALKAKLDYAVATRFTEAMRQRQKDGKAHRIPGMERIWQETVAGAMQMYKASLPDAMAFADDHARMLDFARSADELESWCVGVGFGLERGMPYATAKLFAAKTFQRASLYREPDRLENWRRVAAHYVAEGMDVDAAVERADRMLPELEKHAAAALKGGDRR
jgi:hypothetical protein